VLGSTRFPDGCPRSVLSTGSTRSLSSQSKDEYHAPASYHEILGEALIMLPCQDESGFKPEEKPRQRHFRTGSEPVSLRPFKRDHGRKKLVTGSENRGDLGLHESPLPLGDFQGKSTSLFLAPLGDAPAFSLLLASSSVWTMGLTSPSGYNHPFG
jgi:hypothetical protein